MSELAYHEIANVFPLMEGKQFDELVEDIRTNGLLMPITVLEEKILDGRNRYRACLKAGVAPHTVPYQAKMSPIDFVISGNLRRRHLTKTQLEAVAAELANMKHGGDGRGNQYAKPPNGGLPKDQPLISKKAAAEKLGVSARNVERAAVVKNADPELFQQLKNGKTTVGAAEKKVRAKRAAPVCTLIPGPGQWIEPPKFKPSPTRDSRILAAIKSGNGLRAAAIEAAEADELGFDDQYLLALIDQLKTEAESRRLMQRALEAHQTKRKSLRC